MGRRRFSAWGGVRVQAAVDARFAATHPSSFATVSAASDQSGVWQRFGTKWAIWRLSVSDVLEETADGRMTDAQPYGDLRLCKPFFVEASDLRDLLCCGLWPSESHSVGAGLCDAGFDALAEYLSFKLGEDGQHRKPGGMYSTRNIAAAAASSKVARVRNEPIRR
jgi:hypothetical protein